MLKVDQVIAPITVTVSADVDTVVDSVVEDKVDEVSDVVFDGFESLDGELAIVVVVNMSG